LCKNQSSGEVTARLVDSWADARVADDVGVAREQRSRLLLAVPPDVRVSGNHLHDFADMGV